MKMTKIVQSFERPVIQDIEAQVRRGVLESGLALPVGARVAVTAGSRGVANIAKVIKAICGAVRELGGEPFVIPAMGSHGGATAEGQRALIESYGVTEDFIGAPIVSSMKVTEMDGTGLGHRLFMDANAHAAHGVIVVNRVKVHTDFHGPTESGMMKMCVIGLGKHAQALEMHSFGVHGLRNLIPEAARRVIASGKILLGVGLGENAYDETALVRVAGPQDIEKTELDMIAWNRAHMPALPVKDIDVLVVDRMGKDISGVGIDTNIIGRMRIAGEPEPQSPRIGMIVVDDLTRETHGNATGMGLADFITEKYRAKIDFPATYENILTSSFVLRGLMPIAVKNAATAVRHALRSCGRAAQENPRVLRIRDTLHLSEMYASDALLGELAKLPNVVVTGEMIELAGGEGELVPWA